MKVIKFILIFLASYGVAFAALPAPATLTAESISGRSAIFKGSISSSANLSGATYLFEWGTSGSLLDQVSCLDRSMPTSGSMDCLVNNLEPDTTYFYRVVVRDHTDANNVAELRGGVVQFTTLNGTTQSGGASSGNITPTQSGGASSGNITPTQSGGASSGNITPTQSGGAGGSISPDASGGAGGGPTQGLAPDRSGLGGGSSSGGGGPEPSSNTGNGIVPCGTSLNPKVCEFEDFIPLFNNVMNFLLIDILVPLATLAIAFVGIQYITASGNPSKLAKAHDVLVDVFWGIFIAVAAWAIINTIFVVLTRAGQLPSITG